MPRVVHFEIPADDLGRAQRFYGDVFGWQFQKWDGPMQHRSKAERARGCGCGGRMTTTKPEPKPDATSVWQREIRTWRKTRAAPCWLGTWIHCGRPVQARSADGLR